MGKYEIDSFKNIQELIRFSDQKAGVMLVVQGVFMTLFFRSFGPSLEVLSLVGKVDRSTYMTYTVAVISILFVVSGALVFWLCLHCVIRPKLAGEDVKCPGPLFYFETISRMSPRNFERNYNKLNEEEVESQILEQTHIIAERMTEKTGKLNHAADCLLFSILCFVVMAVLQVLFF
jgi:hypothetical protein